MKRTRLTLSVTVVVVALVVFGAGSYILKVNRVVAGAAETKADSEPNKPAQAEKPADPNATQKPTEAEKPADVAFERKVEVQQQALEPGQADVEELDALLEKDPLGYRDVSPKAEHRKGQGGGLGEHS